MRLQDRPARYLWKCFFFASMAILMAGIALYDVMLFFGEQRSLWQTTSAVSVFVTIPGAAMGIWVLMVIFGNWLIEECGHEEEEEQPA